MAEKRSPSLESHFRTRNRALAREIDALERAADLPSTILILGESGTGKDRLARAIHDVSPRAASPFVRVDAANLSDELFESELFGHERGRLHGRRRREEGTARSRRGRHGLSRRSLVALAGGPGEVPARAAGKELPASRRRRRRIPFRARLIVSSRRDLAALVEQGAFRDDFFYRIDVVSVRLPRLRRPARGHPAARARIPPPRAARAYDRPARRFTPDAEATLAAACVARQRARAAARRREGGPRPRKPRRSDRRTFRPDRSARPNRCCPPRSRTAGPCKELTDAYIDETLRRAGGNRSLAAKRLGVSRKFLWEREKKRGP